MECCGARFVWRDGGEGEREAVGGLGLGAAVSGFQSVLGFAAEVVGGVAGADDCGPGTAEHNEEGVSAEGAPVQFPGGERVRVAGRGRCAGRGCNVGGVAQDRAARAGGRGGDHVRLEGADAGDGDHGGDRCGCDPHGDLAVRGPHGGSSGVHQPHELRRGSSRSCHSVRVPQGARDGASVLAQFVRWPCVFVLPERAHARQPSLQAAAHGYLTQHGVLPVHWEVEAGWGAFFLVDHHPVGSIFGSFVFGCV